jgi:hypothetical protein
MNNSDKEYAKTVKELQQVAKSYGIKFTGLNKSALKSRLTRVGVCYNPETNNTRNCKSSPKSSRKSVRKSSRKSVRKSVRSSPKRKITEYNKFVAKHTKGGKMNLRDKEFSNLWKEHKSRKSRR